MNLDSLIAFTDDKELFVLVYASLACDSVILCAVLAYYTFKNGGGPLESVVIAGLLLLVFLVVAALGTLASQGHFATALRGYSPAQRQRLQELHASPTEQSDVKAAIHAVLAAVEAAFRARANPDFAALSDLDNRVDDLNHALAQYPTFRNPVREARAVIMLTCVGLLLTAIIAASAPGVKQGGVLIAMALAVALAAFLSTVVLRATGTIGPDSIRVRRVDADPTSWSPKDALAGLLKTYWSLGPAMNAFGVRTRLRLMSDRPTPENRPFWAAGVALLSAACVLFVASAAALYYQLTATAYVPLAIAAACVALPAISLFAAFFMRP